MTVRVDLRYLLLTLAALLLIAGLSEIPDRGAQRHPIGPFAWNFAHVPLFAGLAFCVLKTLARVGRHEWARYAVAFAASAACAGLDEWHQSFVPGRQVSAQDFLLDLAGILGALLIVRLRAAGGDEPTLPGAVLARIGGRE